MADFSISVAEDQFICPICLDLLKEPVTVPCGHSYCMSCITDVKCDVCTGRKNKAFKSCLVCLNSYCQTHFEEFHSDKRHKVIDATGRLKQMICQKHDKILEVFCCTDQQFICVLCTMDEHRYHETVSAAEEKSKMQRSAQAAVEDSEKIFSDLIRSIEKSRSEVTKLIRAQERASVSRAEERLEQLKQEITDLRRNEAELEQLSDTDDHIRLLQVTESNLGHGDSSDWGLFIFGTHIDQPYPDHQDRFVSVVQVLCRESVSGRCYWEVDYGQSERLGVSVSYKSISRKGRGNECKFGHNNQSWILLCSPPKYISLHNNIKTKLIVASSSSRIGVYVDHRAGILSFYSVSDTITLIHKVQITFTQPLYPGFSLGSNATVKLCNVKT
uniref:Uncharacterized protein n=1 Tax=Sinocyclocheilus grahami TaxID=75366 RepID=A0A672PQV8_SINGR